MQMRLSRQIRFLANTVRCISCFSIHFAQTARSTSEDASEQESIDLHSR